MALINSKLFLILHCPSIHTVSQQATEYWFQTLGQHYIEPQPYSSYINIDGCSITSPPIFCIQQTTWMRKNKFWFLHYYTKYWFDYQIQRQRLLFTHGLLITIDTIRWIMMTGTGRWQIKECQSRTRIINTAQPPDCPFTSHHQIYKTEIISM